MSDSLVQAYTDALTECNDKQIKEAGILCLKDLDYFPKPSEILKRTKRDEYLRAKEMKERYICSQCHQQVSAISEGKCLDCAGFPPADKNHITLPEPDEKFIIEGRVRCQECGAIDDCIKEPPDAEKWLCQVCYSSVSREQNAKRFSDLIEMTDTKIKPEWVKGLIPF